VAHTTQVCYDYEAKHPVPISDEWREAMIGFEPGLLR
jgi:acyl-CoA thioesterase FadM